MSGFVTLLPSRIVRRLHLVIPRRGEGVVDRLEMTIGESSKDDESREGEHLGSCAVATRECTDLVWGVVRAERGGPKWDV